VCFLFCVNAFQTQTAAALIWNKSTCPPPQLHMLMSCVRWRKCVLHNTNSAAVNSCSTGRNPLTHTHTHTHTYTHTHTHTYTHTYTHTCTYTHTHTHEHTHTHTHTCTHTRTHTQAWRVWGMEERACLRRDASRSSTLTATSTYSLQGLRKLKLLSSSDCSVYLSSLNGIVSWLNRIYIYIHIYIYMYIYIYHDIYTVYIYHDSLSTLYRHIYI